MSELLSKYCLMAMFLMTSAGCFIPAVNRDPVRKRSSEEQAEIESILKSRARSSAAENSVSMKNRNSASSNSLSKRNTKADIPKIQQVAWNTNHAKTSASNSSPLNAPEANHRTIDPQLFVAVLSELQSFGEVDPNTQRMLINDLQTVDPALIPQVLQVYRNTLARKAEQQHTQSSELSTAFERTNQPIQLAAHEVVTSKNHFQGNQFQTNQNHNKQDTFQNTVFSSGWGEQGMQMLEAPQLFETPMLATQPIQHQLAARLIQVLRGESVEGLPPLESFSSDALTPEEKAFWDHTLQGLSTCLDVQQNPDLTMRATLATRELEKALARLRMLGALDLQNMHFCQQINSYGDYQRFTQNQFRPNQEVLVYVEIANCQVQSQADGFHTSLKSSYTISDANGKVIVEKDFPPTKDVCRQHRHDYFHTYRLRIPDELTSGEWNLQLQVEDQLGEKRGQSQIKFEVVSK